MLTRIERLRTADDFTGTVRRGTRAHSPSFVAYARPKADALPTRFGFIVSKKVGNAVVRNTVRRRMKAVCAALRPGLVSGYDVVFRALPPAGVQPYAVLYDEVSRSLRRVSVLR